MYVGHGGGQRLASPEGFQEPEPIHELKVQSEALS